MAHLGTAAEKHEAEINNVAVEPSRSNGPLSTEKVEILEAREVFHDNAEGVRFRTVTWQRATIIFLKIQFAMSILAVPGALATLGAVGGALSILGWEVLNTCKKAAPNSPSLALTGYLQTLPSFWAISIIAIPSAIVSGEFYYSVATGPNLVCSIGRHVRPPLGSHR